MKILITVVALTVSSFASADDSSDERKCLALQNVTIVDGTHSRSQSDMTVVIRGNTIATVARSNRATAGKECQTVSLRGRYVIPGLWDMHVHLAGLSADPVWSKSLLALLVANGITGVRDMGGDLDAIKSWRSNIAKGELVGPLIVASGPMLDASFKDPNVVNVRTPEEGTKAVDDLKAKGADFVKILSDMDRSTYQAIAQESGVVRLPFVGHVPPLVGAFEASNAKQKSIEHFVYGGIALACSSKEQELMLQLDVAMKSGRIRSIAAVLDTADSTFDPRRAEQLWQTFKRNGTWVVPTLTSTYVSKNIDAISKDDPNMKYMPQQLQEEWKSEKLLPFNKPDKLEWYRKQLARQLQLVKMMNTAGVRFLAGTDSLDPHDIPGFSIHKELQLFVEAGLTPAQALQTATSNPAEFFGMTNAGTIAVGKRGDLVILSANPLEDIKNTQSIQGVVVRGTYLNRAALDGLLQKALPETAAAKK